NQERIKLKLKGLSPVQYREQAQQAQQAQSAA
ncbi:IS3 family transposase, partial [Stenotrophomonas hibiscicola]